jgi:N-acetylglucosaminyl-diphospho-decaprenol L-rhamnosyltransferase
LLLLNPDTVILDGAIDKLTEFAGEMPTARIWGGRTLFADHSLNPSSCWGRITAWNLFCRASGLTAIYPNSALFNSEAYGGWKRDSVRSVDIVTGCFFLIERSLWDRLGGFNPLFFMYGEEADLCQRARAFGAAPVVTPAATIIHYGGASERVRADKMVRLIAAKASLIDVHWKPAAAPIGRALLAAWPLSRKLATGLNSIFSDSPSIKQEADVWREIWARRAEWRNGYSTSQQHAGRAPALAQS